MLILYRFNAYFIVILFQHPQSVIPPSRWIFIPKSPGIPAHLPLISRQFPLNSPEFPPIPVYLPGIPANSCLPPQEFPLNSRGIPTNPHLPPGNSR